MTINVKDCFDEFVALDNDIVDLIEYVSEHIKDSTNHETMIAMMQLQIKIFTKLEELQTKQDWIEERIKQLKGSKIITKAH